MSKKEFVKKYKKDKELKKSYDYPDSHVRIDSKEHADSENVNPEFLKSLQKVFLKSEQYSVESMPLGDGVLVLSKTDNNLFNGFYKDLHGQVTEKFNNKTIEIIAKTLLVKTLIHWPLEEDEENRPVEMSVPEPPPVPVVEKTGGYVKLRFGDFEFEMKKSMTKDLPQVDRRDLQKAVRIWKKSSEPYTGQTSLKDSLKELTENWELHQEKFNQILFGVQSTKKS